MVLLINAKLVEDIRSMPRQDWDGLHGRLRRVAADPSGVHPYAKGRQGGGGTYRVRHGDWRAIYRINDRDDVEVISIGNRRDINR